MAIVEAVVMEEEELALAARWLSIGWHAAVVNAGWQDDRWGRRVRRSRL